MEPSSTINFVLRCLVTFGHNFHRISQIAFFTDPKYPMRDHLSHGRADTPVNNKTVTDTLSTSINETRYALPQTMVSHTSFVQLTSGSLLSVKDMSTNLTLPCLHGSRMHISGALCVKAVEKLTNYMRMRLPILPENLCRPAAVIASPTQVPEYETWSLARGILDTERNYQQHSVMAPHTTRTT